MPQDAPHVSSDRGRRGRGFTEKDGLHARSSGGRLSRLEGRDAPPARTRKGGAEPYRTGISGFLRTVGRSEKPPEDRPLGRGRSFRHGPECRSGLSIPAWRRGGSVTSLRLRWRRVRHGGRHSAVPAGFLSRHNVPWRPSHPG